MSKDERQLHTSSSPEEEFSLDAILAEYGKGGRQSARKTAVTEDSPAIPPQSAPRAEQPPEAEAPSPTAAQGEITVRLPKSEKPKRKKKPVKKQDTAEFAPVRTTREPPTAPSVQTRDAAEAAAPLNEEDLPPDRVSLKNVMHDTVDAVLAENDDGILETPPTLKERLQGLMSRRHVRRSPPQDTEQLWQEPEKPRRAPQSPPEPEPDSDEAFRAEKRRAKHLRRSLTLMSVPAVVLAALAALDTLGSLPAVWWENAWLRSGVPGGCLLLAALLAMDVWRCAAAEIRRGHVTGEAGALLLTLVSIAACLTDGAAGRTDRAPFAAAAAALLWVQLWGMLLRAETRREAFQLVNMGGEPPYVASRTDAGICKQKGRLAGFYRMSDQADPARRWEWYLVPLLLSAATVLSAAPIVFISALTGQRVNRLFELINYVNDQASMRITTGMLNSVLADAQTRVQPPTDKGRRLKIYYMTQVGIKPPHFVVFCNDKKLFHFSYRRYLENQIRSVFGLEGTPIIMTIRQKGEDEG